METPFIFGKIATDENFTDREQETAHLIQNFTSLTNTIIISPRRWGKSSLVNKAAKMAMEQDKSLRICHFDLYNVRDEADFYSMLAQRVIEVTSGRWEEAVENAKKFFSRLVPKISVGTDPANEVSISFDWEEVKQDPDEILDLAEKVAAEKGLKIVVCVDEFQNVAEFTDPEYFQRKLRSHWQQHQNVAYCLYGSKRHMMMEVFTNSSKPFYKFGDLIFLNKIDTPCLVEFLQKRFADTGKAISDEAARLIVELTDNHPYYVQQLAQLSWLRTTEAAGGTEGGTGTESVSGVPVCGEEIVREAHASLVQQLSLLFVVMTDGLTVQQLNYLNALSAREKSIFSAETMRRYGITSSTSIARSRDTLVKYDILDYQGGEYSFQDPIYAYWLKTQYFVK